MYLVAPSKNRLEPTYYERNKNISTVKGIKHKSTPGSGDFYLFAVLRFNPGIRVSMNL